MAQVNHTGLGRWVGDIWEDLMFLYFLSPSSGDFVNFYKGGALVPSGEVFSAVD
ncbi:hypothetical protein [Paenalcaligenes hermetiae]|uniref:Uncharacterized protein n=1 Tax=Paenalcaligenes hermetiae TaxID=1157987 RepID=A0ABP9M8I1_9BURK